jgi:dTDP-4-dehydrorhamnose reductase
MGKAVIITGGAGLLAVNWATLARDSMAVALAFHEREVALNGVSGRKVALESVDELVRWMEELRPAVVVHTAGMTNVDACEADPERAQHVNVELAVNVAAACARTETRMVHISTDHLFGGTEAMVDESHPVSPVNVYGRTKAEAEARVLETLPSALVVRTNFYGWGPSYRRSFSDGILEALRTKQELVLFRDVTYTPILIQALVEAVHGLLDRGATGIFNVSGDRAMSKYDFGVKLAEHFQLDGRYLKPGSLKDLPELVKRPHSMSLCNDKTCSLLGRKLGGADEHLALLRKQESSASVKEIRAL